MLAYKTSGQVDIVVGMFLMVLLLVVVLFGFRTTEYVITSVYVEDALAASNLASAVIDLEEYGRTHTIWVKDPQSAFYYLKRHFVITCSWMNI